MLLGVFISSDLSWNKHCEYVLARANKRLYALRVLRKCGVAWQDLVQVYCMKGVVSKETVVLRRWGSSIQKFGFINGVDNVNWPPYRDSKSHHRTEILKAFRISVRWPIYIINSVDKTKFKYTVAWLDQLLNMQQPSRQIFRLI